MHSHKHRAQLSVNVEGFFTLNQDLALFKNHLRDFLVQCKVSRLITIVMSLIVGQEATGADMTDLYLVEREAQLREAAEEKNRRQAAVPGMLDPHALMAKGDVPS
jgi:exportin-1